MLEVVHNAVMIVDVFRREGWVCSSSSVTSDSRGGWRLQCRLPGKHLCLQHVVTALGHGWVQHHCHQQSSTNSRHFAVSIQKYTSAISTVILHVIYNHHTSIYHGVTDIAHQRVCNCAGRRRKRRRRSLVATLVVYCGHWHWTAAGTACMKGVTYLPSAVILQIIRWFLLNSIKNCMILSVIVQFCIFSHLDGWVKNIGTENMTRTVIVRPNVGHHHLVTNSKRQKWAAADCTAHMC